MDKTIRVLLIDDAQFILTVTKTLLEAEGFLVETADSGIDGLARWREWKPDAVLLDLMMPGKSGWEVLEEARSDTDCRPAQVIIFSAKDDPGAKQEAKKRGAYAFILKPFDKSELCRVIREAIYQENQ
jgi:CheY-like chemotaxis protein